jgi:cytochrome c5
MISRQQRMATILTAFLLATAAPGQELPEGAGKEVVQKVCTQCHDLARITSKSRTKEEWNDTVDKMAARGAKASDEEFDAIVTYLAKYFGKEPPPDKAR